MEEEKGRGSGIEIAVAVGSQPDGSRLRDSSVISAKKDDFTTQRMHIYQQLQPRSSRYPWKSRGIPVLFKCLCDVAHRAARYVHYTVMDS